MPFNGKVIIAGTRDLSASVIHFALREVMQSVECDASTPITEYVSGHSGVADLAGEMYAKEHGFTPKTFIAKWGEFGKSAGHYRNCAMADHVGSDGVLVLIWDGESPGSADMKREAQKRGIKIYERIIDR